MGASVSRGFDNQSLIDRLLEGGVQLNSDVERAFRLVDRGDYSNDKTQRVYVDLPWKCNNIHLSAPIIYLTVLQHIDIQPGQRFFNVGSGTGYFSTIVGLLLGYGGINHGIEADLSNFNFSYQRLLNFMAECDALYERAFCVPVFVYGNALDIPLQQIQSKCLTKADKFVNSQNIFNVLHPNNVHNNDNGLSDTHMGEGTSLNDSDAKNEGKETSNEVVMNLSDLIHMDINDDDSTDTSENEGDDVEELVPTANSDLTSGGSLLVDSFMFESNNIICKHVIEDCDDYVQWPLYDRIYVGAGVTNAKDLETFVRLLDIDGILIVPYQNKLLKIKRLNKFQICKSELLSVQFEKLLPSKTKSIIKPPQGLLRQVPCLETLCARLIRSHLTQIVEFRQQGRSTLGHFELEDEEVDESKVSQSKLNNGFSLTDKSELYVNHLYDVDSPCSLSDKSGMMVVDQAMDVDSSCNSTTDDHSSQSSTLPHQTSRMARLIHYIILHGEYGNNAIEENSSNQGGDTQTSNVQNSSPTTNACTDCSASNPPCSLSINRTIANQNDILDKSSEEEINVTATTPSEFPTSQISDDYSVKSTENQDGLSNQSSSFSENRRKSKRKRNKWIPPSYIYKTEMSKLLLNELHLGDSIVRSVMKMSTR